MHGGRRKTPLTSGSALLEALVSLLIISYGMLALTNMQIALSRDAALARQRTEAMHLAQDKIESLRYLSDHSADTANDLASGKDSPKNQGEFVREWTLAPLGNSVGRRLTVEVRWSSISGQAHWVTVSTLLPKKYRHFEALWGFTDAPPNPFKPSAVRVLGMPLHILDLGKGQSAVKLPEEGLYVIVDTHTGKLLRQCKPVISGAASPQALQAALIEAWTHPTACTPLSGLLLAGYLSRDASIPSEEWSVLRLNLGMDTQGIRRSFANAPAISCHLAHVKEPPTNTETGDFISYLCVIPMAPWVETGAEVNPSNWSGKIFLSGTPKALAPENKYPVCRYEIHSNSTLLDANQRNIQPYTAVNRALFGQNYRIFQNSTLPQFLLPPCPTTMTTPEPRDGLASTTGVLHQDCRARPRPGIANPYCP